MHRAIYIADDTNRRLNELASRWGKSRSQVVVMLIEDAFIREFREQVRK